MRHAKSSWKSDAPDHQRPLNRRGKKDAPQIGEKLAEMGWVPDLVVSSDAERTRQTWAGVEAALRERPAAIFTRAFYMAGPREVGAEVERVPDRVRTLMLLGHNEGWEDVLAHLTGAEIRLTTANAALLFAEADTWPAAWKLAPRWRIEAVLRPRELE